MARQPRCRHRRPRQDPGSVPAVQAARARPRGAGQLPRHGQHARTSTRSRASTSRGSPATSYIERRIRAFIRWNAAVMVVQGQQVRRRHRRPPVHVRQLRPLYEIGFNHFFRGKDDGNAGDHVYFQGHAAPGVYARAFLEGRLTEDDLDHFRREIGRERPRPVQLPAPAPDARVLGVPDGQHGPRPADRAVPRPVQPLPAQPAARRHQPEPGVGVPRRRRVRRAGDARLASRWPAARSSTT